MLRYRPFIFKIFFSALFLLSVDGFFFCASLSAVGNTTDFNDNKNESSICLSRAELLDLAKTLSHKVNLFQEVWSLDPKVEFFGGTSRDFLYWIFGHFKDCRNASDFLKIKAKLVALDFIDIKEFMHSESDVDILADAGTRASTLDIKGYGLRRLDESSFDRVDSQTGAGKDEIDQGFLPVEKMRLSSSGIVGSDLFGDGISEVLSGKLTIVPPNPLRYKETKYYKLGINHPVLLALRFIRVLAQDHRFRRGSQSSDIFILLMNIDAEHLDWIKKVMAAAVGDAAFEAVLKADLPRKWIASSVLKTLRYYSNPLVAYRLFSYFGFDNLQLAHESSIPSIHQYLMARDLDEDKISQHWKASGYEMNDVLVSPDSIFPDFFIYHGTKNFESFRSIIFQGIVPSESGSAGSGFYGVPHSFIEVAVGYTGGDKNLIVKVKIKSSAKVIDITAGPGKDLFDHWNRQWKKRPMANLYDEFSEHYGIDILIYPYGGIIAAVVKDSRCFESFYGAFKSLMDIAALRKLASQIHDRDSILFFLEVLNQNGISAKSFPLLTSSISAEYQSILSFYLLQSLSIREPLSLDRFRERVSILESLWSLRPELAVEAQLQLESIIVEYSDFMKSTGNYPREHEFRILVEFKKFLYRLLARTNENALLLEPIVDFVSLRAEWIHGNKYYSLEDENQTYDLKLLTSSLSHCWDESLILDPEIREQCIQKAKVALSFIGLGFVIPVVVTDFKNHLQFEKLIRWLIVEVSSKDIGDWHRPDKFAHILVDQDDLGLADFPWTNIYLDNLARKLEILNRSSSHPFTTDLRKLLKLWLSARLHTPLEKDFFKNLLNQVELNYQGEIKVRLGSGLVSRAIVAATSRAVDPRYKFFLRWTKKYLESGISGKDSFEIWLIYLVALQRTALNGLGKPQWEFDDKLVGLESFQLYEAIQYFSEWFKTHMNSDSQQFMFNWVRLMAIVQEYPYFYIKDRLRAEIVRIMDTDHKQSFETRNRWDMELEAYFENLNPRTHPATCNRLLRALKQRD